MYIRDYINKFSRKHIIPEPEVKNFMINNQKSHAKDKLGFWNQSKLICKGLLS